MHASRSARWRLIIALVTPIFAGCEPAPAEKTSDADVSEEGGPSKPEDGEDAEPSRDADAPKDAEVLRDAELVSDADGPRDGEPGLDAAPESGGDAADDAGSPPHVATPTDTGAPTDASAPIVIEYLSLRVVLPAGVLPGDAATPPLVSEAATPAPTSLRAQSPVYAFQPAQSLSSPAKLSFVTSEPSAIVYAFSSASARFEPRPTRFENGMASADVTELNLVVLGLCPIGQSECGGACIDVSSDEAHCGVCDHACGATEVCTEGACRAGVGEHCDNPWVMPVVDPAGAVTIGESGDLLHAAADLSLPPAVAHHLGRGVDRRPVSDLVWSWTASSDAKVTLKPETYSEQPLGLRCAGKRIFAIYEGGCAPERLLLMTAEANLSFAVTAGRRYHIVAFFIPDPADFPSAPYTCELRARISLSLSAWQECPPSMVCGGACTFASSDVSLAGLHCGGCFHSCGGPATCSQDRCFCLEGTSLCGDTCVDLEVDPWNCGSCGHGCGPDSVCLNGTCAPPGAGLSCANAIELGPDVEWPVRFSMQGATSTEIARDRCDYSPARPTNYARFFRITPRKFERPNFGFAGPAVFMDLTEAQCGTLEQPWCPGFALPSIELAPGRTKYFTFSNSVPKAGRIEITTNASIRFPDDGVPPVPDGTVCGGVWGPQQHAADVGLSFVPADPVVNPSPYLERVLDGAGNALEIKVVGETSKERLSARQYRPQTGWSNPVDIGPAGTIPHTTPRGSTAPQLVLVGDPVGTAFAVWRYSGEWRNFVRVARYREGSGWDSQQELFNEAAADSGLDPPGGLTAETNAGALIVTFSPSKFYAPRHMRLFSAQSGWLPWEPYSFWSASYHALGYELRVGSRYNGAQEEILTAWWSSATNSFEPVFQPSLTGMRAPLLTLVDGAGDTLILSESVDRGALYARYSGGAWSTPTPIRNHPEPGMQLQLVQPDADHAMVLWSYNNVFASCYTSGQGWTPPKLVAEYGTNQLRLVRTGARTLVARWKDDTNEYAARYDW